MRSRMVLSETIGYVTILALTIIFSAFALVIQDKLWRVALKFIAGFFWIVLSVSLFFFMGSDGFLVIMSLPFAIFGLIFWLNILTDFLNTRRERIWKFED